jgi:hypothetical protein
MGAVIHIDTDAEVLPIMKIGAKGILSLAPVEYKPDDSDKTKVQKTRIRWLQSRMIKEMFKICGITEKEYEKKKNIDSKSRMYICSN